ncbi:AEC family transporter [Dolichospermum circinale CS-537/01]|uniref:AEC family transporter n=1 Tax=Dolichospermum circinale CS-537/01 TaxID=3021739 RepID=A0ABT5A4C7_9CYAN|nr:AEC family transporter [Dolichospermum circinale]MDB9486782.1 AEC family transporter [Dolichospermum circinale CS-537/01]
MIDILELYLRLVGLILIGFILGRKLPGSASISIGRFLYWVGVPISIIGFLLETDLSGQIWIAPIIAYFAIFLGALLAWLRIKAQAYFTHSVPPATTQGILILAAMVGNTGYLGFPITLAMVGKEYFAWALFYDMLGSLFGAYGLGVVLAAKFGNNIQNRIQVAKVIFINPALWSFGFGLLLRQVALPKSVVFFLEKLAWSTVALSLMLIGMRLSQLKSWTKLPQAGSSIFIKMVLVPLILGSTLSLFGVTGKAAQVIVLQMAMPPALATLVIAETFDLDRDLAVTALAMGIIVLLFTLPLWLWLF